MLKFACHRGFVPGCSAVPGAQCLSALDLFACLHEPFYLTSVLKFLLNIIFMIFFCTFKSTHPLKATYQDLVLKKLKKTKTKKQRPNNFNVYKLSDIQVSWRIFFFLTCYLKRCKYVQGDFLTQNHVSFEGMKFFLNETLSHVLDS